MMALQPNEIPDARLLQQQRSQERANRELASLVHEYFDDLYDVVDELVATHLVYRETSERWQCMFCTAKPVSRPDAIRHITHPLCIVLRAQKLKQRLDHDARLRNRRTPS